MEELILQYDIELLNPSVRECHEMYLQMIKILYQFAQNCRLIC
jgi:hypothetical protein